MRGDPLVWRKSCANGGAGSAKADVDNPVAARALVNTQARHRPEKPFMFDHPYEENQSAPYGAMVMLAVVG
ncbi:hypothetical protein [Sphingomonas sp.]|uniref:hypothetical protein n=1 Tax=Sphingomonas sp. TaxID=28214 RepID=UPI00325FD124